MRILWRVSLIVSLVVITAVTVGHVARTNELERARDLRLTSQAEAAAGQLAALVDTVAIAAAVGRDPAQVVDSLAAAVPDHAVCAVSADSTACAGPGPSPGEAELDDHARAWRDDPEQVRGRPPDVVVYDRRVVVVAAGDVLSVLLAVPIAAGATVWPTTHLPSGASAGAFVDQGNTRQTAVPVPGVDGVHVVAATTRAASLPVTEQRLHVLAFVLAAGLLVVAGAMLVVEHRGLVARASLDRLTQLPNRSEFEQFANQVFAQDGARGACLLLFDLDGFKAINDTYGHRAGDEVLQVVARRLRRAVRDGDLVARWGGDEFVVLMPGVTTAELGARRARQLAETVAGRARVDGVPQSLRIRTSVGVALWPDHGRELEHLVVAADRAMYAAKRAGSVTQVCTAGEDAPAGASSRAARTVAS